MKFSVKEIRLKAVDEPFTFNETVDVSDITELNNDIRQISPVHVEGICSIDKDELIFTFTVSGEMILPCARTLVDVTYPFTFNMTEVFSTAHHIEEADVENDVHQVTEDTLDLGHYIIENIVLETPYRVISDEKMIEEGTDWNFYTEEKHEEVKRESIDPRLSKLKKLLDED